MTHTRTIFPFAISNESHANSMEFLELKCPFIWKNSKKNTKIQNFLHLQKIGVFTKNIMNEIVINSAVVIWVNIMKFSDNALKSTLFIMWIV